MPTSISSQDRPLSEAGRVAPLPLKAWDRPALLLLMLCVKGLLLLFLADVFYYGEEMEKGAAARLLLAGADLPYHEFAYHHYEGGGFACIHLKALAFLLVGHTVLAHKLVALVWLAGILWVATTLVARHFGRTSALLAGTFLILGPPAFQKLSLLNLGIHFEACLFLLIVFDRALRILHCKGKPRSADLWVLGIASGFGIFYSYQMALAVGYAGLILLLRKPRVVMGKPGAIGALGLLLGALPFWFMAARVGQGVINIHGEQLGAAAGPWQEVSAFLSSIYAQPTFFAFCVPVALLLACLALTLRSAGKARWPGLFLIGFMIFWTIVYLNSAFVVGNVYHDFIFMRFAPLWVIGSLIVAAALGTWMDSGKGRALQISRALAILLLCSGIVGSVQAIRTGHVAEPATHWHTLASLRGYDYGGYLRKLWPRMNNPVEERLRQILAADVDDKRELRAALAQVAFGAAGKGPSGVDLSAMGYEELCALLEKVDQGHLADYHLGLGAYALRHAGTLAAALKAASALPAPLDQALAQGIGRWGNGFKSRYPADFEVEMSTVPADTPGRSDYLQGVAWRAWQRFVSGPFGGAELALEPERLRTWLKGADVVGEADLLRGYAEAQAYHLGR